MSENSTRFNQIIVEIQEQYNRRKNQVILIAIISFLIVIGFISEYAPIENRSFLANKFSIISTKKKLIDHLKKTQIIDRYNRTIDVLNEKIADRKLNNGEISVEFWEESADCNISFKDVVSVTLVKLDILFSLSKFYYNACIYEHTNNIKRCNDLGKVVFIIGIRGVNTLDGRMPVLRTYYDLGVRYMNLNHECDDDWTIKSNAKYLGINDFGADLIYEMNRIGMLIEVSHTSYYVIRDVLRFSRAPVILSISISKIKYEQFISIAVSVIREIKKNNGIIIIILPEEVNDLNDYQIQNAILSFETIHNYTKTCDNMAIGEYSNNTNTSVEMKIKNFKKLATILQEKDYPNWRWECLEKIAYKNILRVYNDVEEYKLKFGNKLPVKLGYDLLKRSEKHPECRTNTQFLYIDDT